MSSRSWNIKNIVVFGDSFSDQGNLSVFVSALNGIGPIGLTNPPAASGGKCFCNGKLLVEFLAEHYGISLMPAFSLKFFKQNFQSIFDNYHLNAMKSQPSEKKFVVQSFPKRSRRSPDIKTVYNFSHKAPHKTLNSKMFSNLLKMTKLTGNNYSFLEGRLLDEDLKPLDTVPNKRSLIDCIEFLRSQLEYYRLYGDKKDIENTLFIISLGYMDLDSIASYLFLSSKNPILINNDLKNKMKTLSKIFLRNILKLQNMGAKKILILPTNFIANVPDAKQGRSTNESKSDILMRKENYFQMVSNSFEEMLLQNFGSHSIFRDDEVLCLPLTARHKKVLFSFPKEFRSSGCTVLSNEIIRKGNGFEVELYFEKGFNQEGLDSGQYPFFDEKHTTEAFNKRLFEDIVSEVDFFVVKKIVD